MMSDVMCGSYIHRDMEHAQIQTNEQIGELRSEFIKYGIIIVAVYTSVTEFPRIHVHRIAPVRSSIMLSIHLDLVYTYVKMLGIVHEFYALTLTMATINAMRMCHTLKHLYGSHMCS